MTSYKLIIILMTLFSVMFFAGCNNTLQDPVSPVSYSPPMNGQPPVVVIESLRGGEYVKGGTLYQIHMVITDPSLETNSSTIEYSRDNGTTWTLALSSTGQNASDFATYSGQDTVFNWSVPRETNCYSSSLASDGRYYRLRVITRGRPDAFATVNVSPGAFTVDSCVPVITNTNFAHANGSLSAGFSTISLSDITDRFSLSPIKDICIKYIVTTTPTDNDPCWLNVNSFGVTPAQASLANLNIPVFFGFNTLTSMTAVLWARDYALNQTELTMVASSPTGVVGTDLTPVFSRTCSGANCAGVTISGGVVSSQVVVNSATVLQKSDAPVSPYNSNMSLLDPQMFVVNSAGIVYLRDKTRGIVKIDPVSGTQTVLIPISGASTDGLLATATVKKPLRLALDSNENLIVFDYDRIRRINLNLAVGAQTIETIVGGGTDASGTVKVATNLQINYHDNILWYGTFQVLPNNWIVFNSENPQNKLNNPILPDQSDRFRLRVYRPEKSDQIVSIKLSGTGVDVDPNLSVNDLWPYGGVAVSYDTANKDISKIYTRLCDTSANCTLHSLGVFNKSGVAISSPVAVPDYYSNNNLMVSRSGGLYSMNRFQGFVRQHNGSVWQTVLGRGVDQNPAGLCANGTSRTSCDINLWDAYVGPNDRLYFIDNGTLRFVDTLNGRVYTLTTLSP